MAATKSVIVVASGGRRQTIKVTPNTTISQILEEACKKYGYNADKYDLKHFNNILDPSSIYRFTGLVNNAQLEMVSRAEARPASNVTIGIQLENGQRTTGEFTADTTLLGVLLSLHPDQHPDKAALIYMHREVYGTEELGKTTLQSLGLNSGRAMLRLICRDNDQARTQAHVSTPLAPQPIKVNNNNNNSKNKKKDRKPPSSSSSYFQNPVPDIKSFFKSEKGQTCGSKDKEEKETKSDTKKQVTNIESIPTTAPNEKEPVLIPSTSKESDDTEVKPQPHPIREWDENNPLKLEFPEDRNAVIFNQAGVKAMPRDELPENFYDLTVDDAKLLLKDAKRRREQLEEAPLQTEAQRQLNQDKRTLELLHKYRRTMIRVQFPDQLVLQGVFTPLEKVQAIKDFIKNYLANPECDFTVYTAPPKHILNPDARLIDENLVPSAIIHYSGSSTLRSNIKDKLIDPKDVASRKASKCSGGYRLDMQTERDTEKKTTKGSFSDTMGKVSNIVPKWFSQSFKK